VAKSCAPFGAGGGVLVAGSAACAVSMARKAMIKSAALAFGMMLVPGIAEAGATGAGQLRRAERGFGIR
jgi:hypothetical protein